MNYFFKICFYKKINCCCKAPLDSNGSYCYYYYYYYYYYYEDVQAQG